jgi:hypothetical protein
MNLSMKNDKDNDELNNIVPLRNDEIKSILKIQSESVFEEKNISNKSDFIKKTLIDIALDYEAKTKKEEIGNTVSKSQDTDESKVEAKQDTNINNASDNQELEETSTNSENDKVNNQAEIKTEQSELENLDNLPDNKLEQKENINNSDIEESLSLNEDQIVGESEGSNIEEKNYEENSNSSVLDKANINSEETQQALNSVRDAVSKSINQIDNHLEKKIENENLNNIEEKVSKDFEKFKNIFSNLSELAETALHNTIQNKIIEIAYDLAGYQIDKMPEKYEKKIKSLLKNINCFEDKITIEVNDLDYQAISKIEKFSEGLDKSIFVPNKDLSRGDIILNCDGMHYSEKNIKNS